MTLSLPRSLIASAESLEAEKQSKIDIGGLQKSVLDTFDSIVPKPKPTVQETLAQAPPTFAPITAESIVQQPIQTAPQPEPEAEPFKLPEHFLQPATPEPAPGAAPLAESPIEGLAPLGAQPISPTASVPAGGVPPVQRGPADDGSLQSYARGAATRAGIDPDIFVAQIQQESGFRPDAVSPAGATGIAQIVPKFHPGVNPNNPRESLDYAANLMANHLKSYGGDYEKSLAAYNAGPGAVAKYGGVPPFQETQHYVKTIMGARQPAPGVAPQAQPVSTAAIPAPGASTSGAFDANAIAQQWAGKQYVFGGAGGRGAGVADSDCSGFVAQVTGLPAHTDAAYKALQSRGAGAISEQEARPGDVVFYMGSGTGGTITHHMGLYAGPGQVLDMSTSGGGGVKVRPLAHGGQYEILRDPNNPSTPPVPPTAAPPPDIVPSPVESGGIKPTPKQIDEWSQIRSSFAQGTEAQSGAQVMPPEDLTGVGDAASQGVAASAPPVRDDYARSRTEALSPQPSIGAVEPEAGTFTAPALSDEEPRDPWQRVGYALRDALAGAQQSATAGASSAIAQTGDALGGAGRDLERAGRGISGAIGDVAGGIGDAIDYERGALGRRLDTTPSPTGRVFGKVADTVTGFQSGSDEAYRRQAALQSRALGLTPEGALTRADEPLTPQEELELAGLVRQNVGDVAGVSTTSKVPGVVGPMMDPLQEAVKRGVPGATEALGAFTADPSRVPNLLRSLTPRLREAVEAFFQRTGNVSQTDVERIARTIDEPVPSWLNPETAGQRVAAPEITGEMPRPLGGGGPSAGIVAQADDAIPAATDRYYHGTGSAFDRPDPKTFDPNGLFGPGYYLTDTPRVAGSGDFTLGPGYAEQRGRQVRQPPDPWVKLSLDDETEKLDALKQQWAIWGRTPESETAQRIKARLDATQARVDQISEKLDAPYQSGPNIRPVDVPRDLRLLDADATPTKADQGRVERTLRNYWTDEAKANEDFEWGTPHGERSFREYLDNSLDRFRYYQENPTGQFKDEPGGALWDAVARSVGIEEANKVLNAAGYDGIRYAGGKRIPMTDDAGKAIEHNAVVIFPESLDKIRNATAGTPGGILPGGGPEARGQLLGAAGRTVGTGVAAGYEESQQEGATPQSILGAAAGGLATGLVGEGIRAGAGGRRAGQIMARATRAAGQADEKLEAAPIRLTTQEEIDRLNLKRLLGPDAPQEVQDFFIDNAQSNDWYHGQRRGVRSWELSDQDAAALAKTTDDWIAGGRAGKIYNAEEKVAIRNAYRTQQTVVADIEEQLGAAGLKPNDRFQLLAKHELELAKMRGIAGVAEGDRAESGRAFGILRKWGEIIAADPEAGAREFLRRHAGGLEGAENTLDAFNTMRLQGGTPQELAGFLRQAVPMGRFAKILNGAQILRYTNLLSGTLTHLVNLGTSSGKIVAEATVTKPIAVGVDVARVGGARAATRTADALGMPIPASVRGANRQVWLAEVGPQLRGQLAGLIDGARQIPEILQTGVTATQSAKLEHVRPGFGSGVGAIDAAAEAPLRALSAEDNMTRAMSKSGHLNELATRKALSEGLTGPAVQTRAAEIIGDPGKHWRMVEEAEKLADEDLFTEDRALISWMQQGKGLPGLVGAGINTVVPFVRAPTNVMAQGLEMSTPLGAVRAVQNFRKGNIVEGEKDIARMLVGVPAVYAGYLLARNGNMNTGRPEEYAEVSTQNPQERPWAIKVPLGNGQTWNIGIGQMGPLSVPMAIGGIVGDAVNRGQDLGEVLTTVGPSIGQFIGDQSMLQGISDFAFAFRQPRQYAERFSEGIASQTVLYGAAQRQLSNALGLASRDPKGAIEAALAVSPLTSGMVPERQDRLGQTVRPTQTGLAAYAAPFRYSVEDYNGILSAFENAGVGIPLPPKELTQKDGTKRELSREQQAYYQRIFGQELQTRYSDLIDPDPTTRAKTARRVLQAARDEAAARTLETH